MLVVGIILQYFIIIKIIVQDNKYYKCSSTWLHTYLRIFIRYRNKKCFTMKEKNGLNILEF